MPEQSGDVPDGGDSSDGSGSNTNRPNPPGLWQRIEAHLPKIVDCPSAAIVSSNLTAGFNFIGGAEATLALGHIEAAGTANIFELGGSISATLGTPQAYVTGEMVLDQVQSKPSAFSVTGCAGELGRAVISASFTNQPH